jgi:DNA topoisomerase-1
MQGEMKTLQTNLRILQKEVLREQKEAKKTIEKSQKKKRVQDPSKPRPPSGIAKPAPITNELCDFLGVAHGTQMSRIEVIKKVNEYISTHNLKNPENKQTITPDAKLMKLLSPPEGAIVKFFNLQTYLKKHFPKAEAAAPAATA